MKIHRFSKPACVLACLLLLPLALVGNAKADERPVVLELFTSQGCYSCPPADANVGKLAKRDDVLPLAFHIDYWDYIGWKDPFAFKAATRRQHDYAARLGKRTVYTPQMIIDGSEDVVGSRWWAIEDGVKKVRSVRPAETTYVPVELSRTDAGEILVRVGKGVPPGTADIWLVSFDNKHVTSVPRGENSGKTLTDYNVVRSLTRVGSWNGDLVEGVIPDDAWHEGADNLAILVQEQGLGAYYGVARLALN